MGRGRSDGKEEVDREAELILRLYELRRETVMRQARRYVGGEFAPKSAEQLVAVVSKGGTETGYAVRHRMGHLGNGEAETPFGVSGHESGSRVPALQKCVW